MSSEDQTEIATGREGIELAQGYVPAQMEGDTPKEAPISANEALDPLRELAPAEDELFTEVKFQGPDGSDRPENESLTAEQAARGLSEYRTRNADAFEQGLKEAIAQEADELRGVKQQQPP
jgi:hypothetical protein